jgi:hypothetical protein
VAHRSNPVQVEPPGEQKQSGFSIRRPDVIEHEANIRSSLTDRVHGTRYHPLEPLLGRHSRGRILSVSRHNSAVREPHGRSNVGVFDGYHDKSPTHQILDQTGVVETRAAQSMGEDDHRPAPNTL